LPFALCFLLFAFSTFAPMFNLLIAIVIGLFVAMLFVNLYFRAKVLKLYGVLVRNKVEFGAAHIFNRQKLEAEVLTRYPQFREEIEGFIRHMRYSIRMATVLILLITAFGAVLMYFR
jgi:predicted RND superfamily exporter protein